MTQRERGMIHNTGYWQDAWRYLCRDRFAILGAVIVGGLIIVAVLAPYLAPYGSSRQFREGLTEKGMPLFSNRRFWLGTDQMGRDLLSRMLIGARISVMIGILANVLAVLLGIVLGAGAGFVGGWVGNVIMRFVDIFLSFPVFLLAVILLAVSKPSPLTVTVTIGAVYSVYLGRIVYSQTVSIKERLFVLAARSVGARGLRILVRHVLPHLVSVLLVFFTLSVGSAIMLEATLSYVGIGVQPPTPTWGNMISEGQYYYRSAPWLVIYPGLGIMLTVLGFNMLGDGLRDALDPTSQQLMRRQ